MYFRNVFVSGFAYAVRKPFHRQFSSQAIEPIMNGFIGDYVKNDMKPESPITFGILTTRLQKEKWTV
jgi:hypothetical protein